MNSTKRAIVWFRRDLRLSDHHALAEATRSTDEVFPLYIIDDSLIRVLERDNRRVSFIQESLDEMELALAKRGKGIWILRGDPLEVLPRFAVAIQAGAVFWNRDYEPFAKARDDKMVERLSSINVETHTFKDQVIFESREILNGSGDPYRVFTPYSRNWIKTLQKNPGDFLQEFRPDLKKLASRDAASHTNARFSDAGFTQVKLHFKPGEKAAMNRLKAFAESIRHYDRQRDFPEIDGTSKLSPHFRFGTLSIRQAVRFCDEHLSKGAQVWLKELIWREFYQMILDQFPHVSTGAFKANYKKIKWERNPAQFEAWCEGRTGYPIVDAAMRQLIQTGWMHNRLRMITAMFLTKDLLIDWREGEKFFSKHLLDLDPASNNGGWQWCASTGSDAQPYFRVMNPVTQSKRYDPEGNFIREFVPELRHLDAKKIHWPNALKVLAPDYPAPIVDHDGQRKKAILLFQK